MISCGSPSSVATGSSGWRRSYRRQPSSVTQAAFNRLQSLEWIRAQQNLAITGPPGTGKSHLLIGCGRTAVNAGFNTVSMPGLGIAWSCTFEGYLLAYCRDQLGGEVFEHFKFVADHDESADPVL